MYIFIVDNFVYVKNNCNTPEVMHFLVAFLVAGDAVFIIWGSFRHQSHDQSQTCASNHDRNESFIKCPEVQNVILINWFFFSPSEY